MRDLLLILIVSGLLPICISRPWVGVLAWSWLGYMNPHRLSWGFAFEFPFAQIVALATLLGCLWYAVKHRELWRLLSGVELKLLLILWVIFTYTAYFAFVPDEAWLEWQQISKILLMAFLTAYLIDEPRKLRLLLLTIAFSIGFFGIKGGIFSILSGGEYRVWGPPGSFIADNNALALGLNMLLPIVYFLAQTETRKWLQVLLYGTFALSIVAILFTYSRGGFIGLVVVLLGIFLTIRMRWKLLLALVFVVSFPMIAQRLPDAWMDRMTSITSYEQDGSALTRIAAWNAAWHLALDRPMAGGGFEALNNYDVFIRYNPGVLEQIREQGELGVHMSGVHSIYFELLGENGFPGLIVFLALNAYVLLSLRQLSYSPSDGPDANKAAYCRMLSTSLLAYLVTGTFLELISFDLFYQIVAMAVVIRRLYAPVRRKRPVGYSAEELRGSRTPHSVDGQAHSISGAFRRSASPGL